MATDHQIPLGVDPLALLAGTIAANYNGVHVAATHCPDIEHRLNDYLRRTTVILKSPWPKGYAVPTVGGTSTNNLSSNLAFKSAGAGLALKVLSKELGIDLSTNVTGRSVSIQELNDDTYRAAAFVDP